MKYDLLIYDSESLVNAFDGRLTAILLGYDVSVCLLPYEED